MHVSLISNEEVEELTQGKDFTINDRQVTLAAPTDLKIKIYRVTTTKPLVGWADASVLRAADMTVQSTQLLHLAEETSDLAQDGGLSKDTADNVWDARFNKIKNLLDPTEPGDAVTLSYITKKQTGLLTQLNATGDSQNTRLLNTGNAQNNRLVTTGESYVSTMTTLKNTATDKATEANNSADLAKKWAVSETSPDGAEGSKSARTWAGAAKISASAAASSANASQTSATNSASSASVSTQKATDAANSASASASSASNAATSASNAKTSETKAASSAAAAKQSEENSKIWDPAQYVKSVTESNGIVTVTKGDEKSTIFNVNKALNDFIASRTLKVGSTVELGYIFLNGFITNGGTSFCFTIPLNKISTENLAGTITGRFFMRQAGKYIFDGNDNWLNLNEYFTINTCTFNKEGFIIVIMNPKKSASNVINNAEFSIEIVDLTFRA